MLRSIRFASQRKSWKYCSVPHITGGTQHIRTYNPSKHTNGDGNHEEPMFNKRVFSRILYGLSLAAFFKVAYDTTNAFWNYRKIHAPTQLQDMWNEAMLDLFTFATKDTDIQKYFGVPLQLGPPPLQSKSPVIVAKEGFSLGVVMGGWSLLNIFGEVPGALPQPSNETTVLTDAIYNEDRNRSKVLLPSKGVTPELPAHIPAPIRASLTTKGDPVIVPHPPIPERKKSKFTLAAPVLIGFLEVELPLKGAKQNGIVRALVYTDNAQWQVKYASVLTSNKTLIKEIVPNQHIPGLDV